MRDISWHFDFDFHQIQKIPWSPLPRCFFRSPRNTTETHEIFAYPAAGGRKQGGIPVLHRGNKLTEVLV